MKPARKSKPGKKLSDTKMQQIKKTVQNAFEQENPTKTIANMNFQFTQIPKKTMKAFLGKIRNHDLSLMANFAAINELSVEKITWILNTINGEGYNILEKNTFQRLENKIISLQRKIKDYENKRKEWEKKEWKDQDDEQQQPKLPNMVAFQMDWFGGDYKDVSGNRVKKQSAEREIRKLRREIQLAGYKDNDDNKRTFYIPLETIRELGCVIIKIDDMIDVMKTIRIAIGEDGDLVVHEVDESFN
ncbi:hypothetical protein ACFFRR_000651 [Megaselia abdita]